MTLRQKHRKHDSLFLIAYKHITWLKGESCSTRLRKQSTSLHERLRLDECNLHNSNRAVGKRGGGPNWLILICRKWQKEESPKTDILLHMAEYQQILVEKQSFCQTDWGTQQTLPVSVTSRRAKTPTLNLWNMNSCWLHICNFWGKLSPLGKFVSAFTPAMPNLLECYTANSGPMCDSNTNPWN
jgi:hypothetical protein